LKVIIDGYNLVKKIAKVQHISSKDRDRYLKELGIYAKNKRLDMIVVFDGGESSFNYTELIYGLEVIYTGFLESADDYINRYMAKHNYQQELIVVTSDREIIDFAKSRKIDFLRSEEFYSLVLANDFCNQQEAALHKNKLNKTTNSNNQELDDLMEQASLQIQTKNETLVCTNKDYAKKKSKLEKQIARKLKKL
jgi:predicted RNA-binding protein with PIN domain